MVVIRGKRHRLKGQSQRQRLKRSPPQNNQKRRRRRRLKNQECQRQFPQKHPPKKQESSFLHNVMVCWCWQHTVRSYQSYVMVLYSHGTGTRSYHHVPWRLIKVMALGTFPPQVRNTMHALYQHGKRVVGGTISPCVFDDLFAKPLAQPSRHTRYCDQRLAAFGKTLRPKPLKRVLKRAPSAALSPRKMGDATT